MPFQLRKCSDITKLQNGPTCHKPANRLYLAPNDGTGEQAVTERRSGFCKSAGLLVALGALLGGCGSMGEITDNSSNRITIESDPVNATVLADGVEIGVTPLTFSPSDAFRSGFTGGDSGLIAYRYLGKLMVRKPGCKDYVTEVNDNLLSKDIHVKLECDPDYRPPAAQPVSAPQPASAAQPAASPKPASTAQPTAAPQQHTATPASVEERLLRIESLHEKGLVTDEEYRQLRKRVLDTL